MALRTFGGVHNRRKDVLARLEDQLKAGTKRVGRDQFDSLTIADVTRIQKEITTLKSRM